MKEYVTRTSIMGMKAADAEHEFADLTERDETPTQTYGNMCLIGVFKGLTVEQGTADNHDNS